jgi:hypothetical protein
VASQTPELEKPKLPPPNLLKKLSEPTKRPEKPPKQRD